MPKKDRNIRGLFYLTKSDTVIDNYSL